MKKVISRKNGKTYYKTIANFSASANNRYAFYKGEIYWVRKAEKSDNNDTEKYVIVKGTFFSDSDNWDVMKSNDPITLHNGYNGTYVMDMRVKKSIVKNVLTYID